MHKDAFSKNAGAKIKTRAPLIRPFWCDDNRHNINGAQINAVTCRTWYVQRVLCISKFIDIFIRWTLTNGQLRTHKRHVSVSTLRFIDIFNLFFSFIHAVTGLSIAAHKGAQTTTKRTYGWSLLCPLWWHTVCDLILVFLLDCVGPWPIIRIRITLISLICSLN